MKDKSDIELYLLVRQKNKDALSELYDRYIHLLYSFLIKMTGDEFVTRDIIQKIFLRLWTTNSEFDGSKGKFISWLLVLSRNIAIDHLRSEQRHRIRTKSLDEEHVFRHVPETVERMFEHDDVYQVLNMLSEEQRKLLYLMYWKGYTLNETAKALNIPEGTAKSRLHQILKKLRNQLLDERGQIK